MPAFAAHHLLGKQVFQSVWKDPHLTHLREQPFLLGAQGPDPLLFHRLIPLYMSGRSARGVSSALHRSSPDRTIAAMADYLREHPGDMDAFSYACGFLTHYALDSLAHPYIYYTQAAIKKRRHIPYIGFIVHNRIEANIDAGMINRVLGEPDARSFNVPELLRAPEKMKLEIGRMLSEVAAQVTGRRWPPAVYAQSFDDMRRVQRILYDPAGKKRGWMYLLQVPFYWIAGPFATSLMRRSTPEKMWDFLNDGGMEWCYPANPEHTSRDSFAALYEQAEKLSEKLIPAFVRLIETGDREIYTLTGDRSFLTGLPVTKEREER